MLRSNQRDFPVQAAVPAPVAGIGRQFHQLSTVGNRRCRTRQKQKERRWHSLLASSKPAGSAKTRIAAVVEVLRCPYYRAIHGPLVIRRRHIRRYSPKARIAWSHRIRALYAGPVPRRRRWRLADWNAKIVTEGIVQRIADSGAG